MKNNFDCGSPEDVERQNSWPMEELLPNVERSGRFTQSDPNPGTIIVNVGYLLMRWSNGRWKNTVHRVSEPLHWKEQGLQGSNPHDIPERGGGGVEMITERYSILILAHRTP